MSRLWSAKGVLHEIKFGSSRWSGALDVEVNDNERTAGAIRDDTGCTQAKSDLTKRGRIGKQRPTVRGTGRVTLARGRGAGGGQGTQGDVRVGDGEFVLIVEDNEVGRRITQMVVGSVFQGSDVNRNRND